MIKYKYFRDNKKSQKQEVTRDEVLASFKKTFPNGERAVKYIECFETTGRSEGAIWSAVAQNGDSAQKEGEARE